MPTIAPCLWFDDQAEAAADHYVSIFPRSQVVSVLHYDRAGMRPEGTVMLVEVSLDGQPFTLLNGGPQFTIDEAVSFQIPVDTQEELDAYWDRLTEGGEEGPCGWLKDRFGVSWQVVPTRLTELLRTADPATSARVTEAFMQMKRLDIATLEAAAAEGAAR